MLTVACVLRSGGIYDASWVARLKAGVAKHLPIEHRFVCLSDVDVPCERIPLEHGWPGWWSKMELFKLPGPALYFDLDTAVVGDLQDLARQADEWRFTILRDFYRPHGLGSGVMAWGWDVSLLYNRFAAMPDQWMGELGGRGDQGFVEAVANLDGVDRWQDVLPDQVVSYKLHCSAGIPLNARIVCLHGQPKFADMPANDPVRLEWERAA